MRTIRRDEPRGWTRTTNYEVCSALMQGSRIYAGELIPCWRERERERWMDGWMDGWTRDDTTWVTRVILICARKTTLRKRNIMLTLCLVRVAIMVAFRFDLWLWNDDYSVYDIRMLCSLLVAVCTMFVWDSMPD